MNDLRVTREILNSIYDDAGFKAEVAELINSLIDDELLKDEPNCDFIDECINTLDELTNGNYAKVIPFVNKHADKAFRQKLISVAAACAVLAAISFGAVAVSHTIEQRKETKVTTTQTTVESTTAEKTTQARTTTRTTTTQAVVPSRIKLTFGDGFKDEYRIGEKLDTSGITAVIIYTDGSERNVPLSECSVTADDEFGTSERYETVTVGYNGLADSFKVRVLRQKETRVLNSVYAAFPEGFDFTAEDTENADLSGMEVYAVYSDKSEEKISPKDYSIEKEKLDEKTVFYKITYKGCSASFGIKERR